MIRNSTAALVALLGLLAGIGTGWAAPATTPVAEAGESEARSGAEPAFDPTVPVFETYRDWPGPEELSRFYGLPWSRLAFNRAELFGLPVFLVLTVDWNRAAQRLATEVLNDTETLRVLNQGYITIVVNADLRPEIRERYQTGAWPVMAFLLPDGKPMLSQVNDMEEAQPIVTSEVDTRALQFLLREGAKYWQRWSATLIDAGQRWAETEGPNPPRPAAVDEAASDRMARWLLGSADREEGGFGAGAKFLVTGLEELAAVRETRGLQALRRHSRLTLERLVESPLVDRWQGGMHRLAAGPSYTGLEYEKLLSVNAHLIRELVVALRGAPSAPLEQTLKNTVAFVTTTLARPEGGFFLAQAADPFSEDGGGYWRERREDRPPPVNEFVLSGPNATAGAALIRAGLWLDDPAAVETGRRALELVLERAYRPGRGVGHVILPMLDPRIYLSTQAEVALGFADAYETTGDARFLEAARDIADFARRNLRDPGKLALRDYLPDAQPPGLLGNERRPLRANVRLARALLRVAIHGESSEDRERAQGLLGAFCRDLDAYGVHGVEAALGVEEAINDPLRIRISGDPSSPATSALRRAAVNASWGWSVVLTGDPSGAPSAELTWKDGSVRVKNASELPKALAKLVGGEP